MIEEVFLVWLLFVGFQFYFGFSINFGDVFFVIVVFIRFFSWYCVWVVEFKGFVEEVVRY